MSDHASLGLATLYDVVSCRRILRVYNHFFCRKCNRRRSCNLKQPQQEKSKNVLVDMLLELKFSESRWFKNLIMRYCCCKTRAKKRALKCKVCENSNQASHGIQTSTSRKQPAACFESDANITRMSSALFFASLHPQKNWRWRCHNGAVGVVLESGIGCKMPWRNNSPVERIRAMLRAGQFQKQNHECVLCFRLS